MARPLQFDLDVWVPHLDANLRDNVIAIIERRYDTDAYDRLDWRYLHPWQWDGLRWETTVRVMLKTRTTDT